MSAEPKASKLIDVVDDDTREGIMRLSQKLKGLQAEITTKLDFLKESELDQKAQLTILAEEIDKALLSINVLVRTEIADGISPEEFLEMNQVELDKFREMVKSNSDQLNKLGDHF
jgi:hypothetical protein